MQRAVLRPYRRNTTDRHAPSGQRAVSVVPAFRQLSPNNNLAVLLSVFRQARIRSALLEARASSNRGRAPRTQNTAPNQRKSESAVTRGDSPRKVYDNVGPEPFQHPHKGPLTLHAVNKGPESSPAALTKSARHGEAFPAFWRTASRRHPPATPNKPPHRPLFAERGILSMKEGLLPGAYTAGYPTPGSLRIAACSIPAGGGRKHLNIIKRQRTTIILYHQQNKEVEKTSLVRSALGFPAQSAPLHDKQRGLGHTLA